jgi:release factor glutamine methyltransferase
VLTPAETDSLREFVKRRGQREPLQHITGSTSFCGFEIAVNRHALVPRPETELLAESGWEYLAKLEQSPHLAGGHPLPAGRGEGRGEGHVVLDFGTGSGCIAIALAAKCPNAKIVAMDISAEALALARENAGRNNVAERIEFVPSDGFAALKDRWGERPREPRGNTLADGSPGVSPHQFDLIISNPPYIPSAEIATLQPEVRDFDPRAALDGGTDGLDFYRKLAAESKPFLKPGGKIMLEFGDGQAAAIRTIFEEEKWIVEAVKEDYSHRQRILVAGK